MSKHTPGPWRLGKSGPNGCPVVGTTQGLMICMLAHSTNQPEQLGQAIGDAQLIAAAPELLQAAKLVRMSMGWQYLSEVTKAIIDEAIDKATNP